MRRLLLALLFLVPASLSAGPDRVSYLLGSQHFGATRPFEQINPGVFFTWEGDFDLSAGVFYNSYGEISPVGTVARMWGVGNRLDLGVFAGLAVYPGDGDQFRVSAGNIVPLFGIQARYGNFFAQFLPADGETVDAVLAVGVTFPLR